MNDEGRRSREAVRNSIRAYGVRVMDPASLPLKKTKRSESQESVDRFSKRSHHALREVSCKEFLHRTPYATLFATLVFIVGLLIYLPTSRRIDVLTESMVENIFHYEGNAMLSLHVVGLVLCILLIILVIMNVVVAFLATGDTRAEVYSGWRARIGGRICILVLLILTYIFFLVWLIGVMAETVFTSWINIWENECTQRANSSDKKGGCIYVANLNSWTGIENTEICDNQNIKKFCKDFVEKAEPYMYSETFGACLIFISLVLFIVCLTANYAKIRCQSKFQELQDIQTTRRF